MPRCSVVIPAFNAEGYLGQAIQSALDQTYKDLEVIVVNDGSTDGTAKVARNFSGRISYLEQENKGTAAARNAGISRASGSYIALLDADDYWAPSRIERLASFLDQQAGFGIVTSDAYLVFGNEPSTKTYYKDGPGSKGFPLEDQLYWIHQHNFIQAMALIRREIVEKCSGFDETVPFGVEDWDFWIRAITLGARVGLLPEPLASYRVLPESLSHNPATAYEKHLAVLLRAQERPETKSLRGLSGRISLTKGALKLAIGDFAGSRSEFFSALRDSGLPGSARIRALGAWITPRLAWKAQLRRFA